MAQVTSLRLREKPERLTSLLREHQQLLARIERRKKERHKLSERLDELIGRMLPVVSEIEHLDRQLHALFDQLLAGRGPKGYAAGCVYNVLKKAHVLSIHDPANDEAPASSCSSEEAGRGGAWKEDLGAGVPGDLSPSRSSGDESEGQSLRALFHRLVGALHPDAAQQEDEKVRRTEVMKELTRAYKDGDLARMLQLEQAWATGANTPVSADEVERRCATLLRTNAALHAQLRQINAEIRAQRCSPEAGLLAEIERHPGTSAMADAMTHREHLRELLSFVGRFRTGELTIQEFRAGQSFYGPPLQPAVAALFREA